MKRTMILYSSVAAALMLFPRLSIGQTTSSTTNGTTTTMSGTTTTTGSATTTSSATAATTSSTVSSATATSTTTATSSLVTKEYDIPADDLKTRATLSFQGNALVLKGTLFCADQIFLKNIKRAEKDDTDEVDVKGLELSDLKAHSSKVGASYVFKSTDPKITSLKECEEAASKVKSDSEKKSFSISKDILEAKESALAGFLNSSLEVNITDDSPKSATYLALEKNIKSLDCTVCNANIKSVRKRISDISKLNLPWTVGLMKALLEKILSEIDERIANAKDPTDFKNARKELVAFVTDINDSSLTADEKKDLVAKVADSMTKIQDRAHSLAYEHPAQAVQWVNLIADTYGDAAHLPGIDKDSRAALLKNQQAFTPGSGPEHDGFVNLVAAIDPGNKVVTDYLQGDGLDNVNALKRKASLTCAFVTSQTQFVQCNNAKVAANMADQRFNSLRDRYTSFQSMNLLGQNGFGQQSNLEFAANGYQNGRAAGLGNNLFGLNDSVFPNAAAYQAPTLSGGYQPTQGASLYSLNSGPYQANNRSLYQANSPVISPSGVSLNYTPVAAIPLNNSNQGFSQSAPLNNVLNTSWQRTGI